MNRRVEESERWLYGGYIERFANKYWWCTLCACIFYSLSEARRHCAHNDVHEWCDACELVFLSKDALDAHMQDPEFHHHPCVICGRVFGSQESFQNHFEYSFNHNLCFFCDTWSDFHTVQTLDIHLTRYHFFCDDCATTHPSKARLAQHRVEQHHSCPICSKTCISDTDREIHMRIHPRRKYQCRSCKHLFINFSHMMAHCEQTNCGPRVAVTLRALELADWPTFYDHRYHDAWYCGCCGRRFESLSALFLHASDTRRCAYLLNTQKCLGKLKAHLLGCF